MYTGFLRVTAVPFYFLKQKQRNYLRKTTELFFGIYYTFGLIRHVNKPGNLNWPTNDKNIVCLFCNLNIKNLKEYWIRICLETYNISQLITQPTRVKEKSSTLIDHIYTNKPENITEVNVPFYSISDHYPVCATRKCLK